MAAVARSKDTIATVINLKSGITQLTIDAGTPIYGLGITRSTIIIVGYRRVITWNLPAGEHILNNRVKINDGAQITKLNHPELIWFRGMCSISISPDFNYIATISSVSPSLRRLDIYDVSTREHLVGVDTSGYIPWFNPDGHEVWCYSSEEGSGWAILKDSKYNVTKLECLNPTKGPSGGHHWESSNGIQVTDDGWILSSGGKQLLWLPHHWRPSFEIHRVWNRQFLAFLNDGLPEVVILELSKE